MSRHNGRCSPSCIECIFYNDADSNCKYPARYQDVAWNNDKEKKNSYSSYFEEQERNRERHHRNRDRNRYQTRRRSIQRSIQRPRQRSTQWSSRRETEDRTDRGRDRYSDDDRDSDSVRRPRSVPIGASGSEIIGYKSCPPNNTILLKGLAKQISECDIRNDLVSCELIPKDIRLLRNKTTGSSRGFAFVEFSTVDDAVRWMKIKQGVFTVRDQYRGIMQYSLTKKSVTTDQPYSITFAADWFCIKCGAQNFKRRETCYSCYASRVESEEGSGIDEICNYATKTIMIRNLDALTTEDSVMSVLITAIPDLVKTISAMCIRQDPVISTSRGLCYLGTENTIDALAIFDALNNLNTPLAIDGKTVMVSYCKYNMGDPRKEYSKTNHEAFPNVAAPSICAMAGADSLAEYAARRYAKTSQEYMHYFEYYRNYFAQQISTGDSITHHENQMDATNAAAAVAQSAIEQLNANISTPGCYDVQQTPTGTDGKKYPVPDFSRYVYDKTTGYQYCSTTGLYYDSNSRYYWNSQIQKWLYWDHDKQTYSLASMYDSSYNSYQASTDGYSSQEPDSKKQRVEKQYKVKVAKKIAKDMERWVRTLNQTKENSILRTDSDYRISFGSASADIGFSVLKNKASTTADASSPSFFKQVVEDTTTTSLVPLVADYSGESNCSGDEEDGFLDYTRLICYLCKRQLYSAEALTKHSKLSALHKQNLEERNMTKDEKSNDILYRDRAKERRIKYGDSDIPLKARSVDMPAQSVFVQEPIGPNNIGNRLLQKMGWTEGQGLGKHNQGRATIIEIEPHSSKVGLGNKLPGHATLTRESYLDYVKRITYARYQQLIEK